MLSLARIGPARAHGTEEEYDVMHGLNHAIEVLCEPSDIQHKLRTQLSDNTLNVINRGRIICLTAVKRYIFILNIYLSLTLSFMVLFTVFFSQDYHSN